MENAGITSSVLFFYLSTLRDIPADIAPFQPSAIQPQKMMLLQLPVDCKTQTKTIPIFLRAFPAKKDMQDSSVEQSATLETGQPKATYK